MNIPVEPRNSARTPEADEEIFILNPRNFRMTCVRQDPEDEAEFAGMVDFVEESDILPTFWRLAAQPPDARRERAAQRRALFRERFTPQRIFERAGIYGRLDRLLQQDASDNRVFILHPPLFVPTAHTLLA